MYHDAWLGFQFAAEEIERRLGYSWGAAQKVLLDAIEHGAVRSQRNADDGDPDVWGGHLQRLIEGKLKPKGRARPQRELAREAIIALWPDARHIPHRTTDLIKPIYNWVMEHCEGCAPPKRDSIRRAAAQLRNAQHASPLAPDM
jgi:hypothetical protein